MKRSERDEWVAALRNPEEGGFTQGDGYLNKDDTQCCLGVKCELDYRLGRGLIRERNFTSAGEFFAYKLLADSELDIGGALPTSNILDMWGLSGDAMYTLADMNDSAVPWSTIAEWIEQNVSVEEG